MEVFDLYDNNRLLTGETMVRGTPAQAGRYRLVVHVCIFNSNGKMLIQQRQPFKKKWGNLWDLTVGGCVVSGETSREGALREVWEELGLEADLTSAPAFSLTFPGGFDDFYILQKDVELSSLRLQKEEVLAAKWASLEDVLAMVDGGTFIPYHKGFLEFLFHHPAGSENGISIYSQD